MNRIPTEGLKQPFPRFYADALRSLNEQNPDRGIETLPNAVPTPALMQLE